VVRDIWKEQEIRKCEEEKGRKGEREIILKWRSGEMKMREINFFII
jgi:hypothetical protein